MPLLLLVEALRAMPLLVRRAEGGDDADAMVGSIWCGYGESGTARRLSMVAD